MYCSELMIVYPTRSMCRIVAMPLTWSRDMYRDVYNIRCGAMLHAKWIIMYEYTIKRFSRLKMDVVEGLSVATLGLAGALYLWLGGKGNRNLRASILPDNYVATWKTFQNILYARFMHWFELMIVYPTRNMCRIVALPLTWSRDLYRDTLNMRCGAVLHMNGINNYESKI